MTDAPEKPKLTAHDKAELLVKMGHEAKMIERKLHAKSCIVICIFEDGDQIIFQDAGRFPMPPDQFYDIVKQAHVQGQLGPKMKTKPSKIIRPN